MTDRLAGLVLPDATPVEESDDWANGDKRGSSARGRVAARIRSYAAGDWLIAGCGVGLAAICALFPWYIFLNQDQFGIRPLTFSGQEKGAGTPGQANLPELVGERIPLAMGELYQLDFIPTGTVPNTPFKEGDLPEQPFPGDKLDFRLVDAANGRAMIEDKDGFWVVQRGSPLPDGSQVAEIVKRGNSWVLVTSAKTEIVISR